jgi:hypothetical protein
VGIKTGALNQMKKEEKASASFSKRYLFLNIVWGMGLTFFLFIYGELVAHDITLTNRWHKDFFLLIIPFLLIESTLHWFVLKYYCRSKKFSNIIWVMAMPIFFLIGYAVLLTQLFAHAVGSGVLR